MRVTGWLAVVAMAVMSLLFLGGSPDTQEKLRPPLFISALVSGCAMIKLLASKETPKEQRPTAWGLLAFTAIVFPAVLSQMNW